MASDEWWYEDVVSRIPNAKIVTTLRDPLQEIRSQMEHDIAKTMKGEHNRYRTPQEKLANPRMAGYKIENAQSLRLGVQNMSYDSITKFLHERIYIVGITDYMWHTFCIFSHMFGSFDASCDCRKNSRGTTRKNAHRVSATYSNNDLIHMHLLTRHDRLLYSAAMVRFTNDLRKIEQARNVSLLSCLTPI